MKNIFVFDVESTSLHGTAFAFGAVVVTPSGQQIDSIELLSIEGQKKASDWVKENVLPSLKGMKTCKTDRELRDAFYAFFLKHKESAEIWSDCNFPVETNFLSAIVADEIEIRQWSMPYPLKDISTIVDVEIDRMELIKTMASEFKKHNPLDDARASLINLLHYKKSQND